MKEMQVTIDGQEYSVFRITNDVNGNPRYIISFLALGLKEYKATNLTRKAGLTIAPNRKDFGGGFTFQSHYVKHDLAFVLNTLREGGAI